MFKELLWYIDDNRFLDIVEKIDSAANAYEQNFQEDSPEHKKTRRAFFSLVKKHAKKSGYIKKLEANGPFNPDTYFFKNAKIDKQVLSSFEKEVVKNHMYQKHLWDFMGTTSSFGIITRLALANNGKSLNDVIPLSFQKKAQKSPISQILANEKNSVPIYLYPDGTASTLYDKNLSTLIFDSTSDKSGFDWTQTGYDPNYTLDSTTQIIYDEKNDCYTTVKKERAFKNAVLVKLFEKEKSSPLSLSLIKTQTGAALLDPFYIFLYKRIKKAFDEKNKALQEEAQEEILSFLDTSLYHFQREKITQLVLPPGQKEDENILKFYKDTLGKLASTNLSFISLEDAKKQEEKTLAFEKDKEDEKNVGILASRISHLLSLNLTGDALKKAIETGESLQDMSTKSISDLESIGLDENQSKYISSFKTDENTQKLFSKTLFNAFDIYPLMQNSISREAFADEIYSQIVLKKPSVKNIEVQTTLKDFLNLKTTVFDTPASPSVKKAFEDAIQVYQSSLTPQIQDVLDNAVLRFNIISKNLQMTEAQVVSAIFKMYSIQATQNIITYKNQSDPTNQRVIFPFPFKDIIDSSSSLLPKQRLKQIDFSQIKPQKGFKPTDSQIDKYLSSAALKKASLDKEGFVSLLALMKNRNTSSQELSKAVNNLNFDADFDLTRSNLKLDDIISPDGDNSSSLNPSLLKKLIPTDKAKTLESKTFKDYSQDSLSKPSVRTSNKGDEVISNTPSKKDHPEVEFDKKDDKPKMPFDKKEVDEANYKKSYDAIKEKQQEIEDKKEEKEKEKQREGQVLRPHAPNFRQSQALPQNLQQAQVPNAIASQAPNVSNSNIPTQNNAPMAAAESTPIAQDPSTLAGGDGYKQSDQPGEKPGDDNSIIDTAAEEMQESANQSLSISYDKEIEQAAFVLDCVTYSRYEGETWDL